jgi:hypothetical protein
MPSQEQQKAYPPAHGNQGPEKLETTRARQGEAPGRMRYVLAISVGLVAVAFAIIYFLNFKL